ncbi:MAG: SDR family oxidoreductase [Bacteroidales bacterium]|jgi:NADP-dependent 3-hydroxy acid dehydrogenase YdfG|nr:SDR family oxidoreductase [Bacteroidales bacterium]
MNPIAIITGSTSGIGKATAEQFAKNGYDLILTGRRNDRLNEQKQHLQTAFGHRVLTLCFDVRSQADVEQHLGNLPDDWKNIAVLVNNAGLAVGLNGVQNGVVDDWERMIDTNVKGLLYVSRTIAPLMAQNGHGHIVNIGSIAGKQVYPNGAVYCATKHAVDALSQGLRLDLVTYGIRVTQICPGAVETEFSIVRFKGDENRADAVYKGFEPLKAEDIADAIFYCVNLPKHVCINDMVIMPTAQASATVFHKNL